MQITRIHWKKIAAAFMLALFAFILAGKNAHHHTNLTQKGSQHEHSVVYPGFDCPICEFQIAADADLPDLPGINFIRVIDCSGSCFNSQHVVAAVVLFPAERGPPAHA